MKKLLLLLSTFHCIYVSAQEQLSYQMPPASILQLADYERAPSVQINASHTNMVLLYRSTYKTLEDLNQDELRLGGLRINPQHQISSTATYFNNIKIQAVKNPVEKNVEGLPSNLKASNLIWSPDETKIAFTHTTNDGLELWIIDIINAKAKKLNTPKLNANLGNPITWFRNSHSLLIKTIPAEGVQLITADKAIPDGPIVQMAEGKISQNRTYQDLLKNKIDEDNFERITSTELYKVSIDGTIQPFKEKSIYAGLSFSPDGQYLLTTAISKPFSYIVPYNRFPSATIVLDTLGKLIKEIHQSPLAEIMPKGFMAVKTGKRNIAWRNDHPATLYYVEALDNGDPAIKVENRDAVYTWHAPFNAVAQLLIKTPQRFAGIEWANDTLAIAYDNWYDTRNTRTYLFNPSDNQTALKLLVDRNYQDIYSNPGNFESKKNKYGRDVLYIENGHAFLIGEGHTAKGQFPFIDKLNLTTLEKKRWYQSTYTHKKENIVSIMNSQQGTVLISLQSASEYPNYYIRTIGKKDKTTAITQFKNPFSSLEGVSKKVIKYTRKDGVQLSGTLYLPANYNPQKDGKLPLLIWAYPAEYKDKNSAGQSSHNPNEFTFPYYGSFVYWVTRGYAVLDDAAFPIIGEDSTEPNDNFIDQLVWNAEAAINAVDSMGYIDRKRVGVGGHSYGAFMTANLLTHSNLFACGIARSGAYNRTLTPFGFQSEQRNFWEASEVYNAMSPFMNAHKMKTPLLLTHGEADNNPGTFTLQTERYFQALKGLGAPVRMVILPKESHSYVAKENIFHLLWEQDQFLEKHLKP